MKGPPCRPLRNHKDHSVEEKIFRAPPTVTVRLEPAGREIVVPRPKNVLMLLKALDIRRGTALVIRDGGLLTQDREVLPGDVITVKIVTSSG